MQFTYTGLDERTGEKVESSMDAEDLKQVLQRLMDERVHPVSVVDGDGRQVWPVKKGDHPYPDFVEEPAATALPAFLRVITLLGCILFPAFLLFDFIAAASARAPGIFWSDLVAAIIVPAAGVSREAMLAVLILMAGLSAAACLAPWFAAKVAAAVAAVGVLIAAAFAVVATGASSLVIGAARDNSAVELRLAALWMGAALAVMLAVSWYGRKENQLKQRGTQS